MKAFYFLICSSLFSLSVSATEPVWTMDEKIPPNGRWNIYNSTEGEFLANQKQGKIHAQVYPVTVTGMLPPYAPIRRLIEGDSRNPIKDWVQRMFHRVSGINTFDDVLENLGLHAYPSEDEKGIYAVPYPNEIRPNERMGFGTITRDGATGFTFSCAACHSSNLFGKTVLGMTNRFPRANEFFIQSKKVIGALEPHIFQAYSGASSAERKLFTEAKWHLDYVGLKQPIVLGLDTSLAQVALSLNHRSKDSYASYSNWHAKFPRRDEILDNNPADSKPAVWWNVKYKNRWLSDGSVISGNPIFTNIIWNEIGRGADLKVLEKWMRDNDHVIKEITTAVFSSQAPRITDFIPAEKIDLGRAKQGEQVFNTSCAKCHGHYDKAWSLENAQELTHDQQLQTVNVRYKEQTRVVDVGTDPWRRKGMKSLEQLNDLAISKRNNIVIKAQDGYVPPPLVGIWARWPYMHNNSVPSLCALLTPASHRPVTYYAGEANNVETDFDLECNGYPAGDKVPAAWKKKMYFYDTLKKGMSNSGHDEGIFIKEGREILSKDDKKNLILFLQTL